MLQIDVNQTLELGAELVHAFGRQIEREEFDRDKPLTLRVVRAIHRSEGSRADLMKNTKRSERVRRRSAGSFRVQ